MKVPNDSKPSSVFVCFLFTFGKVTTSQHQWHVTMLAWPAQVRRSANDRASDQAQELRQLQNQIRFLIRLVIPNKIQVLLADFMRVALRISIQILWDFLTRGPNEYSQCRLHRDLVVYAQAQKIPHQLQNQTTFFESLGNS